MPYSKVQFVTLLPSGLTFALKVAVTAVGASMRTAGSSVSRGHLSMRPAEATLELLRQRARLSGQARTSLAERYLREGLLMDEHPGVHFIDGAMGRRAALIGSGLDVWEVVRVLNDSRSAADAAAYLEIEPGLVEVALRYYGSNRQEIDDWIARIRELSEVEEQKWLAAREASGA